MALTGLQIQKLLPKTNCKECGSNTCMAFAMKLAAKKAELSQCPYASEEAKQVLGAASEPPMRAIEFAGLTLGGETVLYRHEKTFVTPTALAIEVRADEPRDARQKTLESIRDYVLERVGEILKVEMVAVGQGSASSDEFVQAVTAARDVTGRPLVLSGSVEALTQAARAIAGHKSVLCAGSADDAARLAGAAKEHGHALAVTAPDLDAIAEVADKLKRDGLNDLFLRFETHSLAEHFQTSSIARRAALKDAYRQLGYPFLHFVRTDSETDELVQAVTEILKYGGICVLPRFDPADLAPLLTLRLNIFTDPQKPIQVEPNVYPVGEPTADSPVFVTTNFSLTYFIVSGELENAGTSAWLVVPECEGMSVLTAWAAGKLSGASIAKFVKQSGLEARVSTREIIIPGFVSQVSGELEENLPGWKVLVGPQEASDLESFVRARLS